MIEKMFLCPFYCSRQRLALKLKGRTKIAPEKVMVCFIFFILPKKNNYKKYLCCLLQSKLVYVDTFVPFEVCPF